VGATHFPIVCSKREEFSLYNLWQAALSRCRQRVDSPVVVLETALSRENGLEMSRRIVRWLDPFAVGTLVPAYLTHV